MSERSPKTIQRPGDQGFKPVAPRPSRKRGSGGTVFFLLILLSLALFVAQNDDLRERAISLTHLFEREPGETVFPLPAGYSSSFTNDWGASREQGGHEGTDIYAPQGTPVYSVMSGTVTTAYGSDDDGWNTLGGYTVMVRADRDSGPVKRGDRLYYAHLAGPTSLEDGQRIDAGDRIGSVGRTAGEVPGTVADFPPHVHLGWYGGLGGVFGEERPQATSSASGAINPYPLLRGIVNREG
ncbi:MAG: M23 family metallopeptidase [Rubrobacter sp.]